MCGDKIFIIAFFLLIDKFFERAKIKARNKF